MNSRINMQSLYRSPLKTILTLLLLAAAAFLFLYNLGEYAVSDREYREARDKYHGVLTVEEQPMTDVNTVFDFFLMTDDTGRTDKYGTVYWDGFSPTYESIHQNSLGEGLIEKLSSLPHISRVEKRYLTAGVSSDYTRLDTDIHMMPFSARAVLTATVKSRFPSSMHNDSGQLKRVFSHIDFWEYLIVDNVELLAGNPAWLMDPVSQRERSEHAVQLKIIKEEYRGIEDRISNQDYAFMRCNMFATENLLYHENTDFLQPGHRYLMVLRNCAVDQGVAATTELQDVYPNAYYHLFDVGDDSLLGWWPYFVDITDAPENWLETEKFADLRELIRVTNDDIRTFDVVYGDDMNAQRRVAEGRIICEEGRFITPADAGQPVCVVSTDFLAMSGLKLGDTIALDLGNYLSEQYAPLGAVAVTRGRQNTEYTRQEFTIVGAWRDLSEGSHVFRDRYWCWSNNAIFVPSAYLPECRNADGHEFKPSEVSFVIDNAEEIIPFMEKCLPILDEMGLSYVFSDGGWASIAEDLMQARSIALVKLIIFTGAALFALVLTVWLFTGRKKREFAIYRALGMPQGEASGRLYSPFLMLGIVATIVGGAIARVFSLRQLAAASAQTAETGEEITRHTPAGPLLYVVGAVGFLALLALLAWFGILLIRRKSILELLRADGGRQRKQVQEPDTVSLPVGQLAVSGDLGGSNSRNWSGRYLRRLLGRNLGRSLLSLVLALLLAFAFGLLTVLRGIYADLYQNVEVKPVFTGGMSYERALKIADSGFVRDPFYEHFVQDGEVEMEECSIILTNRLDHRVTEPVEWLEGWDEETAMNTVEKVMVMYSSHAEHLGIDLGDKVRVNEMDWWNHVSFMGSDHLKFGETDIDRRDKYRPFFQVVGIIQSEQQNRTVFIPAEARFSLIFLVSNLQLDIAEYTLIDYDRASEFTDYAKGQMDKLTNTVQFTMDTSYADRIYKIHRLIETLYPLTIAAALLLGGVLPGLTVLHASKEISILRALGVKVRKCVNFYTMAQVLCAFVGLILGMILVVLIQRPELDAVLRPFGIYLVAHLAACTVGSGVFAWLSARKHVLAQLQAKE